MHSPGFLAHWVEDERNEKEGTEFLNHLTNQLLQWAISRLSDKAQTLLTPYGLFVLTGLGLRRIPVVLLRGLTHQSGKIGTLLVAGHDPWVRYLPRRFFAEEPQCEEIGNVLLWELPSYLQRLRALVDMTIVRVDRISGQKFLGKDYLAVPEWVGMRLTVPNDLDALVCSNRSIREDLRLARKHKLQSLVTEGEERFHEFYDSMYFPFSNARHGAMAFVKSRHDLRCRLRKGGILWIIHDHVPLAGILFERKNHTLDLQAIGMVTGDLPLKKRGIMAALYYYSIAHARQLNCAEVDFRGVRPSLHDGLFRYKRKWGNTLYDKTETYYDLLIHWNDSRGVIKDFLSHTSLIFREEGGLSAIHTDESQSHQSLWIGGLHRLYFHTESGRQLKMDDGLVLNTANVGSDLQRVSQGAK